MNGRDFTYFHPTLCGDPHFVVTGYTNDVFCTDELQIVTVQQALHDHLRRQGFDAVVFLDLTHGLTCYDEQSYYVLEHGGLPAAAPAGQPAAPEAGAGLDFSLMQAGPLGAAAPAEPAPAAAPARAPLRTGSYPLNRSNMPLAQAWTQVTSLLENTDVRFALVLNNAEFLVANSTTVNILTQLAALRTTRHSVVVYLYRDAELANLSESARDNPLYTSVLRPRIESADTDTNRVLSIRTPNAAEIRNLLNCIRLRPDRPEAPRYPVLTADLEPLAITLAGTCSRKKWGLSRLLLSIEDYFRRHADQPDTALGMHCWKELAEDPGYLPPLQRLERMVGLEATKEAIRAWYARMNRRRTAGTDYSAVGEGTAIHRWSESGTSLPGLSSRFAAPADLRNDLGHTLNVRLLGGPGTGKTTVARLLGELYYDLGLLRQGHTVELNAANLTGTPTETAAAVMHRSVMEALGGVLFLDEAYALMNSYDGQQALDQLVADMSRYEGQLAVVIAGYRRDLRLLLERNEGLPRRFPTEYDLPDYTGPEMRRLLDVFLTRAPERARFAPELESRLDDFCENWVNARPRRGWGNAGEAQNLVEAMIRSCATRTERAGIVGDTLLLTADDIPVALQDHLIPASASLEESRRAIDGMIGLANIKTFLHNLYNGILLGAVPRVPGNYIFFGPPGTGKTTIARRMGELLFFMGILPSRRYREVPANDLKSGKITLERAFEEAFGGVLFIDEAHQLCTDEAGRGIISQLVPLLENPETHDNTCVICAGYALEMQNFLKQDSGLPRRFPEENRIRFENYTAAQLRQILEQMAREQGETPEPGYLDRSQTALESMLRGAVGNFGNGGYIRDTWLPQSRAARTARFVRRLTGEQDVRRVFLTPDLAGQVEEAERHVLTARDIPQSMEDRAGPVGMPLPNEADTWQMVNELYGKQEVVDFIRALQAKCSGTGSAFQDGGTGSAGRHLAFAGPEGSGRHTAARTLARVWKALELLDTADVHYGNRANMVAGYVGWTAGRAQSVIDGAQGGTLIVEYPSAMLAGENSTDFGPEALGVLAGAMSRTDLSIILIDSEEGLQRLFRANSIFQSALARQFVLEEPGPQELERIFRLQTDSNMEFAPELEALLPDFFLNWASDRGGSEQAVCSWGGGNEVSRLVTELRTQWQARQGETRTRTLTENGTEYRQQRRYLTADLFPQRVQRYLRATRAVEQNALAELDRLTGLTRVKTAIHRIERGIRLGSGTNPGCYSFKGNPGTGKTTGARLFGGILRSVHALDKGHVIERTAQEMAAQADRFDKTLKLAKGGVLFIDEAHQLAESGAGQLVIRKLITALEDPEIKGSTGIILAGYPAQIDALLRQDSGLARRFGTQDSQLVFEDYTPAELLQILDGMAARPEAYPELGVKTPLTLTPEFRTASAAVFRDVYAKRDNTFGNAGFVRNYLHDAIATLQERLDTRPEGYAPEALSVITGEDVPARWRTHTQLRRVSLSAAGLDTAAFGPVDDNRLGEFTRWCDTRTVYLRCEKGGRVSEGTGTIVTRDGYVLTCNHVVEGAEKIRARVYAPGNIGGDWLWLDCELLDACFGDCDMGLVKLQGENFPAAALRPFGTDPAVGEHTVMTGYPLGKLLSGSADTLRMSMFEGSVAGTQSVVRGGSAIDRVYLDSKGLHGNSGSPVFSREDGRLIGVFSGSVLPDRSSPDELNFFYPIKYFWERFAQS